MRDWAEAALTPLIGAVVAAVVVVAVVEPILPRVCVLLAAAVTARLEEVTAL